MALTGKRCLQLDQDQRWRDPRSGRRGKAGKKPTATCNARRLARGARGMSLESESRVSSLRGRSHSRSDAGDIIDDIGRFIPGH